MSIWIGLSLLLSLFLGAFLISPLYEGRGVLEGAAGHSLGDARGRLLDTRERLLRAIKDLELDRAMGKVSADDFERGKSELTQEVARVMQELRGHE
jgi:hypothetical protein